MRGLIFPLRHLLKPPPHKPVLSQPPSHTPFTVPRLSIYILAPIHLARIFFSTASKTGQKKGSQLQFGKLKEMRHAPVSIDKVCKLEGVRPSAADTLLHTRLSPSVAVAVKRLCVVVLTGSSGNRPLNPLSFRRVCAYKSFSDHNYKQKQVQVNLSGA